VEQCPLSSKAINLRAPAESSGRPLGGPVEKTISKLKKENASGPRVQGGEGGNHTDRRNKRVLAECE